MMQALQINFWNANWLRMLRKDCSGLSFIHLGDHPLPLHSPFTITMSKVPLYIVAGFLGSGKTTLMRRLLDYTVAQGLRPGVIVNDFGAVNIDSAELRRQGLGLAELNGGCVCCSNASQLPPAVKRLIRNKSDLILVETSGLANPIELLDQVTMPWLVPDVRLASVITIVDAAGWATLGQMSDLAADQVRCADAIIVNKCDLTDPTTLSELGHALTSLNTSARQWTASQADVDVDDLLATANQPHSLPTPTAHDAHIRSLSLTTPAALDRACFEQFLTALPAGVLRAKGIIQTSDIAITSIFQYTPGQYNLYPFDTSDTELISGVIVVIGYELDEAALQSQLRACLA